MKIDEHDLVAKPGDDAEEAWLKESILARAGCPRRQRKQILELTRSFNDGSCPASLVRHLIIDFRMQAFWAPAIRQNGDHWFLLPSAVTLRHSLGILSPYLINVRRLWIVGLAPKLLFDRVVNGISTKIQSLSVRPHKAWVRLPYRYSHLDIADNRPLPLDSLGHLSSLRKLDIHRLLAEEAPWLAKVIPKLMRLEELVVADDGDSHSFTPGVVFSCPMEIFLDSLFGVQGSQDDGPGSGFDERRVLPSNLTLLALIDTSWTR